MSTIPTTSDTATYCQRNTAGTAFLALSGLTFFIATVLVPLRLYVRVHIVKSFWWDDVCLIISYLILIPTFALLWQTAALGLGRHLGCYSLESAITAGKLQYIAEVLEIFSTIFTRTSVALFVIRLFAVTKRLRRLLYAYTGFMIISLAVTGGLVFGQCTPDEALWNPGLALTAKCWSPTVRDFIDYYNGAVSILSDLLLALLPAYFLNKLQMRTRLKLALASLMAFGLIPAICAICRTALAVKQTATDPLYSFAILIVFGSTETSMLIITAAVPALRPLFTKKRTTSDSFSYVKEVPSHPFRQIPGNQYISQAQDPHAATYRDTLDRTSIGIAHSAPIPNQHQEIQDNDLFLMPLERSGKRINTSAV
ncbi:hypothetical protein MMC17_009154 [Xylographa soralifera]|nr:hypothetical protein [Xylographa soralifera]